MIRTSLRIEYGLVLALSCLQLPAAAQPTVVVDETFNYADNVALVAGGWLTGAMGVPAVSNTYFFAGSGSNFISADPQFQPPVISGQTLMRMGNAIGYRELGVTLTEDFTLSAKVAIAGYSRSVQVGLGDASGAGYSLQWNAAVPTTHAGNGHFRIFAQSDWSQNHSPNEQNTPGTAQLTGAPQTITPPTRYALPNPVTNPLNYSPNDVFLGYSEMKLVWSKTNATLDAYQDGTLVVSAADPALYSSFTRLYIGGGTNAFIDSVRLETNQEIDVPNDPGDFDRNGEVDGNDILVWQRGDATASGLLEWVENFPAGAVPAVGAIPEPSAVGLALTALGCGVCRRRARA